MIAGIDVIGEYHYFCTLFYRKLEPIYLNFRRLVYLTTMLLSPSEPAVKVLALIWKNMWTILKTVRKMRAVHCILIPCFLGSLEEIIIHGLKALRDSLPADATLTAQNCSFAYISKTTSFTLVEDESTIQSYLDKLPPIVARQAADSPVPAEVPSEVTDVPMEAQEGEGTDGMDVDPSE